MRREHHTYAYHHGHHHAHEDSRDQADGPAGDQLILNPQVGERLTPESGESNIRWRESQREPVRRYIDQPIDIAWGEMTITAVLCANLLTDSIRSIFSDSSVSDVFGGENQLF